MKHEIDSQRPPLTPQLLFEYDGRHCYSIVLHDLSANIEWQSIGRSSFGLVLMLDHPDSIDVKELGEFFRTALSAGTRAFLGGGSAGELAHDTFDFVQWGLDEEPTEHLPDGILTTWHNDEQLVEILWQAYHVTKCPNDKGNRWPVVVALMESDRRLDELRQLANRIGAAFDEYVAQDENQ